MRGEGSLRPRSGVEMQGGKLPSLRKHCCPLPPACPGHGRQPLGGGKVLAPAAGLVTPLWSPPGAEEQEEREMGRGGEAFVGL